MWLVALLRHAGRLVTKRELLDLVWPKSFVEEGILAVHVSALRKVLGDDGEMQQYIETVARSGYRFVGDVSHQEVRPLGWSVAVLPARPFTAEILSGRDQATGLTLADALIDRLGRFSQIVVRPTRAVHGFANTEENLAAVGRALRVDAVLATTFLRTADRVRVSARLVRAQDGSDLWGSEFDESASGIGAIADAVAGSVAAYLGLNSACMVRSTAGRGRRFLLRSTSCSGGGVPICCTHPCSKSPKRSRRFALQ